MCVYQQSEKVVVPLFHLLCSYFPLSVECGNTWTIRKRSLILGQFGLGIADVAGTKLLFCCQGQPVSLAASLVAPTLNLKRKPWFTEMLAINLVSIYA